MPSYMPVKENSSLLVWPILGLIIVVWLYIIYISVYALIITPIIIAWIYSENKKTKIKFQKIAEERKEKNICNFSRSYNCREIDTWVIRAVYEQIQKFISSKNNPVPIEADDHLFNILGIDEEDLEMDLLEEVFQRTGRSLENTEKNPYYGKVETVRDLVCFVNEQPLLKNT